MKRLFAAFIATIALTLALALPASAGAKTGEVLWLCDPEAPYSEAEEVTFVSAPAARRARDHTGGHEGRQHRVRGSGWRVLPRPRRCAIKGNR
jgi:hypothetical protein